MISLSQKFRSFRKSLSPGRRKLIENFSALFILQGINYILPLITFPYLVRVLGPAKYGLVNFAYSFVWYFILLTDYGFNFSANREASIYREDKNRLSKIYSSVTLVKIILCIMSFIILTILVMLVPKFHSDMRLYYLTFLMVLGYLLFPVWLYQGIERMKYVTVLNVVAKSLFTICIFIFIKRAGDYVLVALLNSFGYISVGVINIFVLRRNFGIKFVFVSFDELKHQFKDGWHVFISTIAVSAYTNTRLFAVGLLTNDTITGFYAIAEKFIRIIQSAVLAPLAQTVYPRLTKIYAEDPARSFRIMRKLQTGITIGYLFAFPILFVFAPVIIKLVAVHIYPETLLSLRLLLIATFFVGANAFRVQFLLVSGEKKVFARIHLIAGGIGIFLTFLLTHWLSYVGPSIALIIIESSVLLLTIRSIKKLNYVKI